MKRFLIYILGFITALTACSKDTNKPVCMVAQRAAFSGCAGIQSYVDEVIQCQNKNGADGMMGHSAASGAVGGAFTVQEKGVDESDMLRIDDHLLFVAHAGGVEVIKRGTLAKIGFLATGELVKTRLFTDASHLLVIGSSPFRSASTVSVIVYSLNGIEIPTLIKKVDFVGTYLDSRYVENKLLLVMNDSSSFVPGRMKIEAGDKISGVKCKNIQPPANWSQSFSLAKIISLDIANLDEEPSSVGFMGGAEQIYVTPSNLYVSNLSWSDASTRIIKVDFNHTLGRVSILAKGKVPGAIKDRWAFKEFTEAGLLSVVATSGDFSASKNHLSVFAQRGDRLEIVAQTPEFGHKEDIRAVRYIGNMAYAVTFKKTDPLFAIDLTDPLSPKLKGELVVPGFSAYLQPYSNGKLIGVGFDAKDQGSFAWFQGVQFSLFDVNDPFNLRRLDNITMGKRGSYSDPTSDSHALYSDPDLNRVAFPIVELTGTGANDWDYGDTIKFSGAIVYDVGARFTEVARLSHSDFVPESCKTLMSRGQWWQTSNPSYDINRIVRVDGKLLSVSRFALMSHCLENPSNQASTQVVFGSSEEEERCRNYSYLDY